MKKQKINEFIIKDKYAEMIILLKGKQYNILIDKEDIEKCKRYKWHVRKGSSLLYVRANAHKEDISRSINLARYLTNCPRNLQVDHINRNTLDNRKSNLRCVDSFINARNKTFKENRNIYWNKSRNKYQVSVRFNNKNISGGYFDDIEDAKIKAKEMRKQYFEDNNLCQALFS